MLRRSLTLLAVLALAAGCASSGPSHRQRIIDDEVARLGPPDVPLASYGTFEMLQVAMSPEVASKPEKIALATQLGDQLRGRLVPMFQGWTAAAPAEARGRRLTVQATVVSLRVVSAGARVWAGAWAGDSSITVDLELVDAQTGRAVARQRIDKKASAISGTWSSGSTDQNLVGYVVDIAQAYLWKHHG